MADDYMSDALLGPAPRVSPAVQRLRDRCRGPVKQAPLTRGRQGRKCLCVDLLEPSAEVWGEGEGHQTLCLTAAKG